MYLVTVGLGSQGTSVGRNLQEDKPEVSGESVPEGGVRLATGSCGIKSKGSTLEYSGIVTIK